MKITNEEIQMCQMAALENDGRRISAQEARRRLLAWRKWVAKHELHDAS